eukprot:TRINITY_DN68088_c0_g1_i1.p1 TRINITY_DN68088_c0_g1~~TRINITY_DN68088_c0_g1_i1.p1  ORF type:complete len:335 (+),score=90.56 TRINITY_DN68088_c0_g1_i1:37-1005(+)
MAEDRSTLEKKLQESEKRADLLSQQLSMMGNEVVKMRFERDHALSHLLEIQKQQLQQQASRNAKRKPPTDPQPRPEPSALEKELAAVRGENVVLETRLENAKGDQLQLTSRLAAVERELKALRAARDGAMEQCAARELQLKEAKARIRDLERQVTQRDKREDQVRELRRQLNTSQRELEQTKAELHTVAEEQPLEKTAPVIEWADGAKVSELREEVSKLQAELASARETIEKLQHDVGVSCCVAAVINQRGMDMQETMQEQVAELQATVVTLREEARLATEKLEAQHQETALLQARGRAATVAVQQAARELLRDFPPVDSDS